MKSHILTLLKSQEDVVSGEILSDALKTSRVSIWKHIRKLQDLGYQIDSSAKGYRLINSPDIPYPWEMIGREDRIHYYPEMSSTMDTACELARKGCPSMTVVIAGRQLNGRGRMDRKWLSDIGGLYFTMVLRPAISPALSAMVNFAASLSLVRTIRDLYDIKAQIRWPNDLLVNGKKLSGMLSEMEASSDIITHINIGIGVNVNNDPSKREPNATSLKFLRGQETSIKQLLTRFLEMFEPFSQNPTDHGVLKQWKKYAVTLGRDVKITTIHEEIEGRAVDVGEHGELILKLANGSTKSVIYGDCFHQ